MIPMMALEIMDSYFPNADFFTENLSVLDRHIERIKRNGVKIDYVSICLT